MPDEKPAEKPLNSVERKMLKELVENDFASIERELAQYTETVKRQREIEITEEFAAQQPLIDAAITEWQDKRRELEAWFTEFSTRWRDQGVMLAFPRSDAAIRFADMTARLRGKEEALNRVENDVRYQLNFARTALQRQSSEIKRKILLSGLSGSAATSILDSLPNPQSLLEEALATRPPALTSGRT